MTMPTLEDVGRFTRWAFFALTLLALVVLLFAIDRSVFDTPLAQLTINALLDVLWRGVGVLALGALWLLWAIADKRHYRRWGYLGLAYLAAVLVYGIIASSTGQMSAGH